MERRTKWGIGLGAAALLAGALYLSPHEEGFRRPRERPVYRPVERPRPPAADHAPTAPMAEKSGPYRGGAGAQPPAEEQDEEFDQYQGGFLRNSGFDPEHKLGDWALEEFNDSRARQARFEWSKEMGGSLSVRFADRMRKSYLVAERAKGRTDEELKPASSGEFSTTLTEELLPGDVLEINVNYKDALGIGAGIQFRFGSEVFRNRWSIAGEHLENYIVTSYHPRGEKVTIAASEWLEVENGSLAGSRLSIDYFRRVGNVAGALRTGQVAKLDYSSPRALLMMLEWAATKNDVRLLTGSMTADCLQQLGSVRTVNDVPGMDLFQRGNWRIVKYIVIGPDEYLQVEDTNMRLYKNGPFIGKVFDTRPIGSEGYKLQGVLSK